MKKFFKFCFKWGGLTGFILLSLVLIVEACMPGDVSASHSNTVGDIVNSFIDIDFDEKTEYINPTKVEISNDKTTYSIGEHCKIETVVYPSNSSNKSIQYFIDNTEIATINNQGEVVFFNEGTVVITVQIKDTDLKDTIEITSNLVEADAIEIVTNNTINKVEIDEIEYLSVIFTPTNVSYKNIDWSSSDDEIATIDSSGKITPHSLGTVTFTAKSSNNLIDTIEFEIIDNDDINIKPTSINITYLDNNNINELDLIEKNNYQLGVVLSPSDTTNKSVKWISSDNQIASVQNGVIQANKYGTVTITVISLSDETIKKTITLNISSLEPKFTIKNVNSSNKLTPNSSCKLELDCTQLPTDYTIKYESSDSSICSVSEDGTISTIKEGKVNIKVVIESIDGKKAEQTIALTIENAKNASKVSSFYHAIRKGIGHFGAFFILAIMSSLVVIFFFKRKVLMFAISAVCGFLIAFATELIQLFVPGRSGNIKDIGIDYAGFACGTIMMIIGYVIVVLIMRKVKKNGNKKK